MAEIEAGTGATAGPVSSILGGSNASVTWGAFGRVVEGAGRAAVDVREGRREEAMGSRSNCYNDLGFQVAVTEWQSPRFGKQRSPCYRAVNDRSGAGPRIATPPVASSRFVGPLRKPQ
jgi:hypothetical protein